MARVYEECALFRYNIRGLRFETRNVSLIQINMSFKIDKELKNLQNATNGRLSKLLRLCNLPRGKMLRIEEITNRAFKDLNKVFGI